jgi:Flp pilus assembly pilin Flp
MRIFSFPAARSAVSSGMALFASDGGASLIEYALVLGIVSVAAITALGLLGHYSNTVLSTAAGSLGS